MKKTILTGAMLVVAYTFFASPASANNEALAKAQFMLRQAAAEKSKLTAENQKLALEKKALEKRVEALENKFNKQVSKSKKTSAALGERYASVSSQLDQERQAHTETAAKLKALQQEQQRVMGIASRQVEAIDLCVTNNRKLYEINRKILGQYEEKGVWGAITQSEPFTGLKQVEIENLVDDYQYRLDDLRVEIPEIESAQNL